MLGVAYFTARNQADYRSAETMGENRLALAKMEAEVERSRQDLDQLRAILDANRNTLGEMGGDMRVLVARLDMLLPRHEPTSRMRNGP